MRPSTLPDAGTTSRTRTLWVDAEVHLFPPQWCASDFQPPEGETTLRRVVFEHPEREAALSRASEDGLLSEMERSGVEHAVIMGLPWRDAGWCRRHNQYIADVVERHPGRFVGLGVLPTPDAVDLQEEVRRIEDLGLRGVKVIPTWQGYALDDRRLDPALQTLTERDMVFMTHVDHLFVPPGEGELPSQLLDLARRHPDLRIIAPHLGGLLCLYALHEPIRPLLANILFVASVPLTMPMVRWAVEAVGVENVAFGTDFPFNPSHDQATLCRELESLGFSEAEIDAVAGRNALRFLGVEP